MLLSFSSMIIYCKNCNWKCDRFPSPPQDEGRKSKLVIWLKASSNMRNCSRYSDSFIKKLKKIRRFLAVFNCNVWRGFLPFSPPYSCNQKSNVSSFSPSFFSRRRRRRLRQLSHTEIALIGRHGGKRERNSYANTLESGERRFYVGEHRVRESHS